MTGYGVEAGLFFAALPRQRRNGNAAVLHLCLQRVRRVHQMKMQVWGDRVATVPDPSQHLADADLLPPGDDDAPRARCAYSAYVPAVATITWLPASRAGSSPPRANPTVVFTATQDSRTGWSHWRSGTPSTAWTITPSKAAWTGCPQP
jgi:hypothetical protein